ncbi:MAG: hypothetical protein RSC76_09650, partial [Oscillospiraceae bacterium]
YFRDFAVTGIEEVFQMLLFCGLLLAVITALLLLIISILKRRIKPQKSRSHSQPYVYTKPVELYAKENEEVVPRSPAEETAKKILQKRQNVLKSRELDYNAKHGER